MSMTYIKLFIDYLDAIEPLGDAERGRLFTSLLEYAKSGEAPHLSGNERFIFPMIRAQIDRDRAAFDEDSRRISEARREAGRKGGLAKAGKLGNRKQNVSNLAKEKDEYKDKDKDKDKDKHKAKDKDNDKDDRSPLPPVPGVSPKLQAAFDDWLAYKRERREDYKPMGLKALETQVLNNAANYGEAAVVELIRECMANGWRGIIWDRLRERKGGGQRGNGFQTSNPFLEMLEEERGR